MDYKLKEIILNYFTAMCAEEIQTAIAKYEDEPNGDERIREKLSEELDRLLSDDAKFLPEHVEGLDEVQEYLTNLLEYIKDNVDTDDLVTYLDWE